jgi:hypothetical protein
VTDNLDRVVLVFSELSDKAQEDPILARDTRGVMRWLKFGPILNED